ncbi:MAG: sigma-70 family RNA polymerase sigma factor, partial [Myxococcales bacterium]|nr:sigma-70 family RNA polymerase sigma factor [Myxococcales bacterium]
MLAILVRITGDLGLAEEVVQEALVVALTRWPTAGVPDDPRAWVITTARNLAIDRIRRRRRFDERSRVLGELASLRAPANPEEAMGAYPDERLRLLFTCCHPALDAPSRVALTLRTVGGLTSDEIARAFLVSRTTMQQRLVRAKKKIAAAGIPYAVPDPAHLEERLSGVLAVVYLIFNAGYGGRDALAGEAIWLARALTDLLPDEPEVAAPELAAAIELEEPRLPPSEPIGDHQIVLPYEGEGRNLAIPVVFQHGDQEIEVMMMLDTGATYTTLSDELLTRLGIQQKPNDPVIRLHTANGEREAHILSVEHVWLGDLRLDGVALATCDECSRKDTAGLLGL